MLKLIKKIIRSIIALIKRRYKLIIILILIGLVALFLFYRQQKNNQKTLKFEAVKRENLTKTLEVSGVIDAKEKVRLRFLLGGKVVYLSAKEGDYVNKGQTIATIDQQDLKKRLEKDLNLYMQERWDWEQLLDDTAHRALPEEEQREKDQAQWDLDNTVIDVEIRDIAIKDTILSTPIAGIMTKSPTATAGVQLLSADYFEIVNPKTLVFLANIDEADISLLRIGQNANLVLDSYPDDSFSTYTNYVSYTSSQTATGTVFLTEFPIFSEDLNKFRLGMNGDITIEIETKENILTIPLVATRERDEGIFVDVRINESEYMERKIETGLETDDQVEVLSGLEEGEEVLIPE